MAFAKTELSLFDPIHPASVFAVARGLPRKRIIPIVEALERGGIRFIEITLNSPNALAMIYDLRSHFDGRLIVGAGTVMSVFECEEAVRAGAQVIISPHTDPAIIRKARERDEAVIPGASTPTEIVQAMQAGAHAVKLFPVQHHLSSILKELKGPFPEVPFVVMGGITPENVAEVLNMGVFAAGAGSTLFPKDAIDAEDDAPVEAAARALVQAALKRAPMNSSIGK